jgi:hypothetical protein
MKLSTLMIINAVIALVFGIAFVLAPGQAMQLYGVTAEAPLELVAQLLGAAFISFGVLTWSARNIAESEVRRAIILALFIGDGIGFLVSFIRQIGGVVNALGWSTVAIYLLLALGWGYFRFLKSNGS